MDFKFIKGQKEHLTALLEMIKDLATFERAPDQVINQIEWMQRDGFGPGKVFDFYLAVGEEKVYGMAITYFRYSSWRGKTLYLEDIFIKPEFRGHGIGKAFFKFLAKKSLEQGCNRMAWQVLDWNSAAINFYEGLNSKFDGEWVNCSLEAEEIQQLAESE